jgi:hypothetical protein
MEGTFKDLEPADLDDRICAIRVVRVAGQKQVWMLCTMVQRKSAAVDLSIRFSRAEG